MLVVALRVVPVIVAALLIVPKPEVIDPALRAPVPVIAVATASLTSTRAVSRLSSRLNSVALTVIPLITKLEALEPVTVTAPVALPRLRVLPAVVAMTVLPAMEAPPDTTVSPVRLPSVPLIVELPVMATPPEDTVRVVSVGAVAKTKAPLPVSSLMAPEIPALVVVAVIGDVPLPSTRPLSVPAPVPPLATPRVPVQPRVRTLLLILPVTLVSLVTDVTPPAPAPSTESAVQAEPFQT